MSADLVDDSDAATEHAVSRVSYHHVNVDAGNESVLLRFEYENRKQASCILVDAGEGVELDPYLRPSDSLVAVCLTHAHADHYQSLENVVRSDVPVLASPSTAEILETVLASAADRGFVTDTARVCESVKPVDTWTDVAPGVRIHPIPSGHAPGAVGYVIRFRDDGGAHDILFTGDFTYESAGGYPGFDPDVAPDVEALFLTVATAESSSDELTAGIATALERAHGGASVLVTAGGLDAVHLATLLTSASTELALDVPIRIAGQAAKLYEDLEYEFEAVRTIPEFGHTTECLDSGAIAIAGPDVPTEGSSGRLYDALSDDPNACLVQFVSSGKTPISGGGPCATFAFAATAHPSRDVLDSVVDEIDPVEVVTVHEHGGAGGRYNDWKPCVWSDGSDVELTLFDDGRWLTPPWMHSRFARVPDRPMDLGFLAGKDIGDLPLVSLDRTATIDLEEEGIDIEQLRERLHLGHRDDHEPTQNTTSKQMTDESETPDQTNRSEQKLFKTVGADVERQDTLSTDSITPKSLVSARAWNGLSAQEAAQSSDTETHQEGSEPEAHDQKSQTTESDSASTTETETETEDADVEEPATTRDTDTTPEADTRVTTDTVDENRSVEKEQNVDAEQFSLEIDPLLLALVEREGGVGSTDAFVAESIQAYLEALLRTGEPPAGTVGSLGFDVTAGTRLTNALDSVVEDDGHDSLSSFVRTALTDLLGATAGTEVSLSDHQVDERLIEAAVANDRYGFDTRGDFADAAILWALSDEEN
ncbi:MULTISPECIES: MBL fold metallo-hydrolase [Haloferax]|uniref:MBL fold metallo-hydrolase n=1 Tax=Haloferax marinum TaxID=2666143 RepID=A0A6A8GDS5_9EURY|nr:MULTISPECIES: MBL fold metallo-hydrolase [Haloferax]KAB1190754.1 MBL fold metallo-hydrolase [Haloferax sp. CBA1150]MRW98293.1 MBL fold metallo-hydrolase [Haloferax marinum]